MNKSKPSVYVRSFSPAEKRTVPGAGTFLLLTVLLCSRLAGQELHRLATHPVDFHGGDIEHYSHAANQIVAAGDRLYIRCEWNAHISVVALDGEVLGTIGRPGQGPGEFAGAVKTMAVMGRDLFALPSGGYDRLLHFRNGEYYRTHAVQTLGTSYGTGSTNAIAVNGDYVVISAHPAGGKLGFAYDRKGRKRPVGELIVDRQSTQILEDNPLINDCLWAYGDGHWFAVMRYELLVLKFNGDFELVASFTPKQARLEILLEEVRAYDRSRFTHAPPFFKDAKYHNGSLYLMAPKTLVRVDPTSGGILGLYSFTRNAEDMSPEAINLVVHFYTFALVGSNKIYLGPDMVSGHDLWHTELPNLYPAKHSSDSGAGSPR